MLGFPAVVVERRTGDPEDRLVVRGPRAAAIGKWLVFEPETFGSVALGSRADRPYAVCQLVTWRA
jgi:hypothetical protein